MKVALTFDAENTERSRDPASFTAIMDALRDADVRATFFLQAPWCIDYPDRVRRVVDEGHLIGNHGGFHAHWDHAINQWWFKRDIQLAEEVIESYAGISPRPFFRTPYGDSSAAITADLTALGYRNILWNVDSLDWKPETKVPWCGFGINLFHTWSKSTAETLRTIIQNLQIRNAQFVTVADL